MTHNCTLLLNKLISAIFFIFQLIVFSSPYLAFLSFGHSYATCIICLLQNDLFIRIYVSVFPRTCSTLLLHRYVISPNWNWVRGFVCQQVLLSFYPAFSQGVSSKLLVSLLARPFSKNFQSGDDAYSQRLTQRLADGLSITFRATVNV